MGRLIYLFHLPHPIKRDYAKANKDEIQECLSNIDWDSKFENLSVNDMVSEFTTTVLDILSRLIPNKIAICNDKDPHGLLPRLKQQLNISIKFTTNMSIVVEGSTSRRM